MEKRQTNYKSLPISIYLLTFPREVSTSTWGPRTTPPTLSCLQASVKLECNKVFFLLTFNIWWDEHCWLLGLAQQAGSLPYGWEGLLFVDNFQPQGRCQCSTVQLAWFLHVCIVSLRYRNSIYLVALLDKENNWDLETRILQDLAQWQKHALNMNRPPSWPMEMIFYILAPATNAIC